jgi:hydroxymethylglutaryl-CoA lyase
MNAVNERQRCVPPLCHQSPVTTLVIEPSSNTASGATGPAVATSTEPFSRRAMTSPAGGFGAWRAARAARSLKGEPRISRVRVAIREVGPRDGFQNEPEVVPTDEKVRLIEMLARSGLKRLEVTSFVRADVIPQLADGADVLARIDVPDDVSLSVLIPNERGLDNALAQRDRFHEVNVFLSASETHNRKNVNRSIEESMAGLETVLGRARQEGLRCEGVISVAFGCPYEGHVPPERVFAIARRLIEAGAQEIGFGDTTGMANPAQVREFFPAARAALGDDVELTAHFHNTRGQGLANVLAALDAGVRSFESSFGELGGCPVPRGATGNIATEDLVSMLHEMGVETGVSLERLLEAARAAQEVLGRPLGSHVLTAGPVVWNSPR